MRMMKILLLLLIIPFLFNCSGISEENDFDANPDAASGDDVALDSEELDADNSEDLQVDNGLDQEVAQTEAGTGEVVAPTESDKSTEPPAAVTENLKTDAPAESVVITSLDYKSSVAGGSIVIGTDAPARFSKRSNPANNQVVIEIENADLPAKFKRPYNTKEFSSTIRGFQAYQSVRGGKARVVVQLRGSIEPEVRQEQNTILVSSLSASESELADVTASGPVIENISSKGIEQKDSDILGNKNFDAFLLGQSKFYGRPISVQVRDADIRDVFNLISEESGLNIVLTDNVKGKVTLKLKKIPWDQALVVIMKANQLGYVRQGSIIRIAPLKDIQTETEQAKGVLDAQKELVPLRVRVFAISYAKSEDLAEQAKAFVTKRGSIKADKRTNSLVVTDIEESIDRIAKLVVELDTQTPQVLIEARIIEARKSFQRLLGIQWSASGNPLELGSNTQGGAVNLTTGFRVGGATAPRGTGASLSLGTLDFLGDLDARLGLFELEEKVKVISSPKIVTLNGEQSNIEQTTQIPIQKTTVVNGVTQTSTDYKDVTLQLQVKPQISADGGVALEVKVKREFPGADLGEGRPINKREATTKILALNGQTIVMGGIYQSDVSEGEEGIPFLRKIPILGSLFRTNITTQDKNELLIFLTPRVLNLDKAFKNAKGI